MSDDITHEHAKRSMTVKAQRLEQAAMLLLTEGYSLSELQIVARRKDGHLQEAVVPSRVVGCCPHTREISCYEVRLEMLDKEEE